MYDSHGNKARSPSGAQGQTYFYMENDRQQIQIQQQKSKQRQRSAEASAQMVYEVYGNVIGILEEFEQMELRDKKVKVDLCRSEIYMPSQSNKEYKDIKRILETQLLLFETQLKSCRQDIRENVKKKLQSLTMQWNAERHSQKLPFDHKTDRYAGQLFEILALGSTTHPEAFYQSPEDVKGVTPEDMETVISAQYKIGELDRNFEDPTRRATIPKIRSGDMRIGADRIRSTRTDLQNYIPPMYEDEDMK